MMQSPFFSTSPEDPSPVGMSDEEELRRMGMDIANAQGVGEVLVDYEDELTDLGIRPE